MAKKAGDGSKSKPAAPATVRVADVQCMRRGCGQVHPVCLRAEKLPGADDWLTYICPTVHQPAGVRFGDLAWQEVAACPDGSIVIGPR